MKIMAETECLQTPAPRHGASWSTSVSATALSRAASSRRRIAGRSGTLRTPQITRSTSSTGNGPSRDARGMRARQGRDAQRLDGAAAKARSVRTRPNTVGFIHLHIGRK